jgi:hypothetical protein
MVTEERARTVRENKQRQRTRWVEQGLCTMCGRQRPETGRRTCTTCCTRSADHNKDRRWRQQSARTGIPQTRPAPKGHVMQPTSRLLPITSRVCPGNTGVCGARLFTDDQTLICLHGHRWAYLAPLPKPNGSGPMHKGQRME